MITNDSSICRENFKPGDYIFFEGDLDYHFYIVEKGEVRIFMKNKAGARIDVTTIREGESFGEFALLEKSPRSASAQALSDCTLIRVSEKGYNDLLSELPIWAAYMLKSFAFRLMQMNDRLKESPQFIEPKETESSIRIQK
jgi:CRP-like cAMP-binding protein